MAIRKGAGFGPPLFALFAEMMQRRHHRLQQGALRPWEREPSDPALLEFATNPGRSGSHGVSASRALAGGPLPAAKVNRMAREHGLTAKAVRSAREALGVKIERDGFGHGSQRYGRCRCQRTHRYGPRGHLCRRMALARLRQTGSGRYSLPVSAGHALNFRRGRATCESCKSIDGRLDVEGDRLRRDPRARRASYWGSLVVTTSASPRSSRP